MKQITRYITTAIVSLLVLLSTCLFPVEGLKVFAASSGTATWCIELFTVGGGYLAEPVQMEIRPGENAARQLIRLLHETGYVGYYGGTLESQFYLGYVGSGNQTEKSYNGYQNSRNTSGSPKNPKELHMTPKVPPVLDGKISQALEEEDAIHYYDPSDYVAGYLGEFDIANGSGWMYSVNNVFPGVGFADTHLSDGDVVRVQFTLAYGNDIGGGQGVGSGYGSPYYAVANKDRLTQLMAKARQSSHFSDSSVKKAYDAAKTAAEQVDASQSRIDAACDTLRSALRNAEAASPAATGRPGGSGTADSSYGTAAPNTTSALPGATSSKTDSPSSNTSGGDISGSEGTKPDSMPQVHTQAADGDPSRPLAIVSDANRQSGGSRWIGWLIGGIIAVCAGAGVVVGILYRNKKWIFASHGEKENNRNN